MASECEKCGSNINIQRYCKNCGTESTNEKIRPFKCPECGTTIYYSDFCNHCCFKVNKDLNYIIKEPDTKTCPKCFNENNPDAEFCVECGETLPIVSNLELIKCPECKHDVRNDVNFCRFCGHNFITNEKPFLRKRYKPTNGYCQNCGKRINKIEQTNFCPDCGTIIPQNKDLYSTTNLSHEQYQLIFINEFIVPLSNHYNENFRETTLSEYFDITPAQESHIIFLIMNSLVNEDLNINIIECFEKYLEEANNSGDSKKEILSFITTKLNYAFNDGISISDITTIDKSYYKTVETPVIQDKHSGLTKGVATLGFGLVGFAATSGIKQTTATKKILQNGKYTHRKITIKDKCIVLKTYDDISQDLNFNSNSDNISKLVYNWEDIKSLDKEYYFIFNTGETLKCPIPNPTEWIAEGAMRLFGTTDLNENYRISAKYIKELKNDVIELFFDLIRNKINNSTKLNNSNEDIENNDVHLDKLERIMKMYQDGLLTDDEFTAMKQNIIESMNNKNNNITINKAENTPKFCANCGSKIIENSNFCIECGNKLYRD